MLNSAPGLSVRPENSGRLTFPHAEPEGPLDALGPFGLPGQDAGAANHPQVRVDDFNLAEVLYAAGSFNIFLHAVEKTYLAKTLEMPGPFTVFAPTDQAFARLPAPVLRDLFENPESYLSLVDILANHVVNAKLETSQLNRLEGIQSLGGQMLEIGFENRSFTVGGASVILPNVIASNGVIHGIDALLLPKSPTHADSSNFSSGFQDASVRPVEYMDLIDVMERTGEFDVFLNALKATGLENMLRGTYPLTPYTVFAPTDKAFEELPAATSAYLVVPDNAPTLTQILLFHIVPGILWTEDLSGRCGGHRCSESAQTLLGRPLFFSVGDRALWVNEAQIVSGDLRAANGVVHGIDKLLFP
jgi:uncharacterized surface protein with fasciclin (FAS1) repeats